MKEWKKGDQNNIFVLLFLFAHKESEYLKLGMKKYSGSSSSILWAIHQELEDATLIG